MSFENKTAVIIGGANELGKRIIELLAENGANIVIADADETRAESLASSIGRNALSVPCDVSLQYEVDRVFLEAVRAFSKVDILINNAGVLDKRQSAETVVDDEFETVMAINAHGPLRTIRKALPIFFEHGGGAIVNVSSPAGERGDTGGIAYTASKHALNGITRHVAHQYQAHGIRCNAVAPGAYTTTDKDGKPRVDFDAAARLIVYLASEEAHMLNGVIMS